MNLTETLNDRENLYGDFGTLAEAIQALKALAHKAPSWPQMTPVQREAMDMAIVKQCRILYGNPHLRDSWLDFAGYAHLAVEEMAREEAERRLRETTKPAERPQPGDLDELAGRTPLPPMKPAFTLDESVRQ